MKIIFALLIAFWVGHLAGERCALDDLEHDHPDEIIAAWRKDRRPLWMYWLDCQKDRRTFEELLADGTVKWGEGIAHDADPPR